MVIFYYQLMFVISVIMVVAYAFFWHKHFDGHFTIMTVLVPIINLGFLLLAQSRSVEEGLTAVRLTYLGGCFLMLDVMFLVFSLCGVPFKRWIRVTFIIVSCLLYISALTIGHSDIFYVSVDLEVINGVGVLINKKYGFIHYVFYAVAILYYVLTIGVIVYSFIKKKQVPRKLLMMICVPVTIAMIGFFGGRLITRKIELLPLTYNIGMVCYMIIVSKARLYDPSDSVVDSLVQRGDTGFVSIDHNECYLGSNERAKSMFSQLNELEIDKHLSQNPWADEIILPWIRAYGQNKENNKITYSHGDKIYLVNISDLNDGSKHMGYQLLFTDDTTNQRFINLIKEYNTKLENEVAAKTEHIIEMQDKLVLGMATMVEGRDNFTGGHIKRTSDVVRILVEEIKKDNVFNLSDSYCKNVIKAAPMHDLGKITIDDAILRKPGKYVPKEYEVMKTHAAEGARIVSEILSNTDDEEFKLIAENMAHYHHERFDGSGYPEKLKGEAIPLEARIMAIADVFDALVSKRVYKEEMSFEEADKIIGEGMGTQFDPKLYPFYEKARKKLEDYYRLAT
ncbi:MAG: HD domain-containing protein [Clostridia bacterium]|nr:HD domain-containing protein [Clostridia bacterium]